MSQAIRNFEIINATASHPDFIQFCRLLDMEQNAMEPEREKLGVSAQKDLQRISDILLMQDGNKSIGCIAFIPFNDRAIICRAYVDPQYRGQGLAGILVNEIESLIKQKGYKIAVARILNKNAASLRAFEKRGYRLDTEPIDDCKFRVYLIKEL